MPMMMASFPSGGSLRSKSIIDLTLDDDDDGAGDKNAIEVSYLRITARQSITLIPSL
jgi:hypothetical protein